MGFSHVTFCFYGMEICEVIIDELLYCGKAWCRIGAGQSRGRLEPSRHGPPDQQGKGYDPELVVWGVQPTG